MAFNIRRVPRASTLAVYSDRSNDTYVVGRGRVVGGERRERRGEVRRGEVR